MTNRNDQRPRELSHHERAVSDYYAQETALYIHSWDAQHFHFGIFEPGDVGADHHHPTDVPGLHRALRRMIDRVTGPAAIEANMRIVDAGCGVGGTAFELAARFGAQVTGVNICEHQLKIARLRGQQLPCGERVDFRWGDCSNRLPFDDNSIDVVTNLESACHYSDRGRFLQECMRVLRPGGCLVAMDWVVTDGLRSEVLETSIRSICELWHIASLETPQSYRELIAASGLELTSDENLGDEVLPNAILFARGAAQLEALMGHTQLGPDKVRLMRQFKSLSCAWLAGEFGLYRYVARKAAQPSGPIGGAI